VCCGDLYLYRASRFFYLSEMQSEVSVILDPPVDDIVKTEDRALVKDVMSVLYALQHPNQVCKTVTVSPSKVNSKQYEVCGLVDSKSGCWQVSYSDLDIIRQLNYSHVGPISVKGTGSTVQICVMVTSLSERAMVTECDVIRVCKRSKWFGA
jgi:hypothetical protein